MRLRKVSRDKPLQADGRQMVLMCSAMSSVDYRVSANQTLGEEMSSICVLITTAKPSRVAARAAHFHGVQETETKVEIPIYRTGSKSKKKKKTGVLSIMSRINNGVSS